MLMLRFVASWTLPAIIMVLSSAFAGEFPNKPIRIVCPQVGGGVDVAARLIAPELAASLGQQVVVDNRASSSGIVAAQTVANASPDGYTLLLYGSGLWLLPFMREHVPYDPIKDFLPITLAGNSPNILVVNTSFPAHSVKDLIALAKAAPGKLNYGTGSLGSSVHLAAELFKSMAGVDIVLVPYKGGGAAVNALAGGEVQLVFPTVVLGMPHVKAGRLRALAITSAEPSALAPGLPTVAAAGLPGYESVLMAGAYAPAKTPATIINRLNREIVRVLNKAEVKEKFLTVGIEVVGSSPQQLAAMVKSDMARMGKLIKDAGIRVE